MRASGRAARWVVAGAAAVAVVAWLAWLPWGGGDPMRALVESPETGIRRALAAPVRPGLQSLASPGASIRIERVRYSDLLVTPAGERAEVVALADADGAVAWRGHEVGLAYVGREQLAMVRCPGAGWCVEGEPLPRLAALLPVLARRADAFADADAERYRPLVSEAYRDPAGGKAELLRRLAADLGASPRARLRPVAWQIRIEREAAQVGEDYEVAVGGGPPRRLRARLDLRYEAGRWRFVAGL